MFISKMKRLLKAEQRLRPAVALLFGFLTYYALPPLEAQTPDVVGQWSSVIAWPVVTIHSSLLPNGKVLVWDSPSYNDAKLWDPVSNGFTPMQNPTVNIFCTGHALLT